MIKVTIIILAFLLFAQSVPAQILPRSGTHFTFGIPESADNLSDPLTGPETSILFVNIVSRYDGRGIITSPSGFCEEFTFVSDSVTTVMLPYSLMHLNDIGKTNKGILIRTSQPVNVTFHDFIPAAGEATQIYPDEALDTNYRVTTWGIYDDPGEDNHSQFIITAARDTTSVTITPSVNTLGNNQANVPFTVTLNRGECYIVKADITDLPADASLSGSIVTSTKPVSIISAVSCGYNPLGDESCNELLDEILPRRIADTIFYVAPLLSPNATNTILLTSDTKNFFVFTTGGFTYNTTNGRLQLDISYPDVFTVTAPAQCYLLTEGSQDQLEGDPTMVTILPLSQYTDTMLWYTPDFQGAIQYQPAPFENFVSVIYPEASTTQILLDGVLVQSLSNPQTIVNSPMTGIIIPVDPGIHTLTSPVPIFAVAAGFADADGYSFIPGTTAPRLKIDTIPAFLSITAANAKTCSTFDAAVNTIFNAADAISSVDLTVTYDPNLLTLLSAKPGPAAQGGLWTVDLQNPGIIRLTASCLAPFPDSDAILLMTFSTGPAITTTTISADIQEMGGKELFTALAGNASNTIIIHEFRDTIPTALFSVDPGQAIFGSYDTATVSLINRPNEMVTGLDIYVSYNHDLLSLLIADFRNTLIPGLTTITPTTVDQFTDKIELKFTPALDLNSAGVVVRLLFQTYVTDTSSGNIQVHTSFLNSQPCPLGIFVEQDSGRFTGTDTCGTSLLRGKLMNKPFSINSIVPNPSGGSFTVDLDRHLFAGDPVHLALYDLLGNEIWNTDYSSAFINEKILCTLPYTVSAGAYYLRASITGHIETQRILIQK